MEHTYKCIMLKRCLLFFLTFMLQKVEGHNIALLIIDVQNCFLPNGSLPVTDGEQILPVINDIRAKHEDAFSLVVLTQDWHCSDHISFASQHDNMNQFEYIYLQYDENGLLCDSSHYCSTIKYNISQRLWPDHCVINTTSAEFSSQLTRTSSDLVIRKGYNCKVDSYSAFYDNGDFDQTELDQILKSLGIDIVFVVGLAEDYCVYYTSVDAKQLGYTTYMIEDATRGVSSDTTIPALADMRAKGVNIIQSQELDGIIQSLTSDAVRVRIGSNLTYVIVTLLTCLNTLWMS